MGSDVENLRLLGEAFTHSTFILKFGLIFLDKLIDEFTIFLQVQFAVVIYFDDDGLFRFNYLTLHVKFTHEWVLQDLKHGWPFLRIEVQDLGDEVQCIRSDVGKPLLVIFWLYFGENIEHFLAKVGLQRFKVLNSRSSGPGNNSFNLIEGRVAWKHRLADDKLAQHASKAPHISRLRVLLRPQQNLRRAVPSSGNILGEDRREVVLLMEERPHQPKVTDLGMAILIDEHIGRLDIPMYKFCRVEVVDGLGDLIHNIAFMLFAEHVLPDERVEVDVHVLEEDVDILLIQRADDLPGLHDVRVLEFLQIHDLAVCALGIRCVLEGVKILLQREELAGSPVHYLPHDSVGAAADLFCDLEALGDMRLDFIVLTHYFNNMLYQHKYTITPVGPIEKIGQMNALFV